ncbi:hypothetical protein HPB51_000827 [Rhipicephalus microplus]|uniref:Autophagy-related protein 101 n=1 Tax=Rhipicephalus microplus TaxID=6941 RepID=A0A9J6EKT9_RHIMP|nr:hypothetical protein HPB51_000827 [Rhipicephalus microplus]
MNARSEVFELCLEGRQVQEAVSGIFHTLLFHRTQGKFQYKTQGRYSVGTVGFEDVTCDFIDFTYVRCASDELNEAVCRDVTAFSDRLRSHDGPRTGQKFRLTSNKGSDNVRTPFIVGRNTMQLGC